LGLLGGGGRSVGHVPGAVHEGHTPEEAHQDTPGECSPREPGKRRHGQLLLPSRARWLGRRRVPKAVCATMVRQSRGRANAAPGRCRAGEEVAQRPNLTSSLAHFHRAGHLVYPPSLAEDATALENPLEGTSATPYNQVFPSSQAIPEVPRQCPPVGR